MSLREKKHRGDAKRYNVLVHPQSSVQSPERRRACHILVTVLRNTYHKIEKVVQLYSTSLMVLSSLVVLVGAVVAVVVVVAPGYNRQTEWPQQSAKPGGRERNRNLAGSAAVVMHHPKSRCLAHWQWA
eukprot:2104176-Rhodomonas_salina.1